jgi:hypothetical protein
LQAAEQATCKTQYERADQVTASPKKNGDIEMNPEKAQMRWFNGDYCGGGAIVLLGAGAALEARSYGIGTLSQMGAGFFPFMVGVLLAIMGLVIVAGVTKTPRTEDTPQQPPEWRGWICILLGIIAFIVLGTYGGLLPASFAIVFISALGDRTNTVKSALMLAGLTLVIAVAVFWWALQLQLPLFTWG